MMQKIKIIACKKLKKILLWCILVKWPHILVQMPHSAKWMPDSYYTQNSTLETPFYEA